MKPDTQNPGAAALAENSKPEISADTRQRAALEVSPQPGQSQASSNINSAEVSPGTNGGQSSAPDGKGDASRPSSFESTISQMPAEDTDRIEHRWVEKAKEIEAGTAGDPYSKDDAQHALSRAYLKNRFGMDVK